MILIPYSPSYSHRHKPRTRLPFGGWGSWLVSVAFYMEMEPDRGTILDASKI